MFLRNTEQCVIRLYARRQIVLSLEKVYYDSGKTRSRNGMPGRFRFFLDRVDTFIEGGGRGGRGDVIWYVIAPKVPFVEIRMTRSRSHSYIRNSAVKKKHQLTTRPGSIIHPSRSI